MKEGTRATNKNVESGDILLDSEGVEWVLWDEPSFSGRLGTVRQFDTEGQFVVQQGVRLDDEHYTHAGRKWVEPPPPKPIPRTGRKLKNTTAGWLAPDGRFFACGYAQHKNLSWEVAYHDGISEKLGEEERWTTTYEDKLEQAGYIKLTSFSGGTQWFGRRDDKPITKEQKKTITIWSRMNPDIADTATRWLREDLMDDGFTL